LIHFNVELWPAIDSSSFLTAEEKQRLQRATIEHYTPGRSSISVREKQKVSARLTSAGHLLNSASLESAPHFIGVFQFYADLIQYIDSIFTEALSSSSPESNESTVSQLTHFFLLSFRFALEQPLPITT
jgi:hypothetical protein